MGGAIALNSFGQITDIAGCISMSPYASCETQLDLMMDQYHFPKWLQAIENPLFKKTLEFLYGKESVRDNRPEVQITKANNRPVM